MELFESISKNKFNSAVIVGMITVLFSVVIYYVTIYFFDDAYICTFIAVLISAITAFISYNNCDKMVLQISGATPVNEDTNKMLVDILEGLTIAAGLPMPKFYIIGDSAPNAFATGKNPEHAVICVTSGLVEKLNRDELEGVLAHELSHIKNYDILLSTIVTVFVGFIIMMRDVIFRSMRHRSGRRSNSKSNVDAIGYLILVVLLILSPIAAKLMQLALSRQREYMADARAIEFTRNPNGLISALMKISNDTEPLEAANKSTAHMYICDPLNKALDGKKAHSLFSTHPPIEERIKRLQNIM